MTQPSRTVGNYEFLGVVDKPKAGVTYKVRNLTTGEFEALRALPHTSNGDSESQGRFLREIRMHTRLSHPNIVAFHDAMELDGDLVMTAEFVEGTTWAQRCSQGPLPPDQAIRAACDVLAGLEEAHALGIVHRGITAEHVMFTASGAVKLGGFGLAKPSTDLNLTRAGTVVGDARYMSPEQVTAVSALDGRADLYSVGILLFYGLTGRFPFEGANDFDVMVAQVSNTPPRPSSLNPRITPELEKTILRALAKKPEDRFSGAGEFRAALGIQEPAVHSPAAPEAKPPGSKKTLYVVGAVSIAVAIVILVLVAMRAT
jgi:serine/threonine-protein kinase